MGSGGREKKKRRKIRADMAQGTWAGGAGVGWKYWGPACKVDLFVGDAPCLAGLGQAGPLDVMRDVVTKVGFSPGTYMMYNAGARGSEEDDDELAAWTDPRDRDMEA